jgi:two-component sensor histidine kinase
MKALIAPLLKLLTWIAGLTWLRFDAKRDQRVKDRMKASEARVQTLKEMRDETAKAMAQDDADLVRSLTNKRR